MSPLKTMTKSSLASWEAIYSDNKHLSVWPWTDVVSLTKRFARLQPAARVLELGCGAGANIPFFQSLGVEYWGIEGSASIVTHVREAYPDIADRLVVGDFSKEIAAPGYFDLIVDRGSITHNSTSGIRRILEMVKGKLAPQGVLLGVDWFSTEFSEYRSGQPGEDEFTRINFTNGRLSGTGLAHFCDEPHLRNLLSAFAIDFLEHKTQRQVIPAGGGTYAAWNLVARPA